MKFQNYELEHIAKLFFDMRLKGKDSRMRSKLLRALDGHLKQLDVDRNSLIEENSQKNEDGSVKIDSNNENKVLLVIDKIDSFHIELDALMQEEAVIEENDSNKMMLLVCAELILNSEVEVSHETAIMYDNWCKKFEDVIGRYEAMNVEFT